MTNINTVSALDQAITFLRAYLASRGTVAASQVLADAHAQGVTEKTLRRAKDRLGVIVKRVGEKGKRRGFFTWELETLDVQEVEQPAFADNKHDNAIVEVSGFFCHACVMDKPAPEASPDPRYCLGCYDFLLKEAELLDGRKPTWVPKDSQSITRTPLEPSCKPIQPASGVGHNYIDTQIGSGIMSTVNGKKSEVDIIQPPVGKVTREKKGLNISHYPKR